MIEILKNGRVIATTSNDWTWAKAVYPPEDGYVIRIGGPCTCTSGNICDSCYGKAYASLYSR